MSIKPMMAEVAQRGLARQGFASLFPKIKTRIVRRGEVIDEEVDLLPGYGLVCFDAGDPDCRWEDITHTRGVRRLLPVSDRPMKIPSGFVEQMVDRISTVETVNLDAQHNYVVGQLVDILSGPFTNFQGVFMRRRNKGWAELEVSLFGNITRATVAFHQIRPAVDQTVH
jgi:transcription antitermination factor NusG